MYNVGKLETNSGRLTINDLSSTYPLEGYVYKCILSWVSVSQVSIGVGYVRDSTDTITIKKHRNYNDSDNYQWQKRIRYRK